MQYRIHCIAQIGEPRLRYERRYSVSCLRPMPRVEDTIRSLCSELLSARDDKELGRIVVELREALHRQIERLRERYGSYPFVEERRRRNQIPPPKRKGQTDAAEETNPTEVNCLEHGAT